MRKSFTCRQPKEEKKKKERNAKLSRFTSCCFLLYCDFFFVLNHPDLFQCLADKFTFMTKQIKRYSIVPAPPNYYQHHHMPLFSFYYMFYLKSFWSKRNFCVSSEKFPASWKFNFTKLQASLALFLVGIAYINFTLWASPFYYLTLRFETDSIVWIYGLSNVFAI